MFIDQHVRKHTAQAPHILRLGAWHFHELKRGLLQQFWGIVHCGMNPGVRVGIACRIVLGHGSQVITGIVYLFLLCLCELLHSVS